MKTRGVISPFLEVVFAALIWGSNGIFIKSMNLPPEVAAVFRMVVPTALILIYFAVKKIRPFQGNNKIMLTASSINAARMFLFLFGFTYASIGNAVIILYTWPIFAALFGVILLKERITQRNTVLFLSAFIGIILVFLNREISFSNPDFFGMSAILISSVLYAITFVIYKKESLRNTETETIVYQNVVGAVVFLPFIFVNPIPTFSQIGLGVTYGVLIGLVGFKLMFSALKRLKASTVSLITYLEVISAIIFGIIIFDETLTPMMILGGVLIVISAMLIKKE